MESKEPSGCGGGQVALPLRLARCERRKQPSGASVANAATELVLVRFEFPDGSVAERDFQLGQTVEVLKAHLASEFGVEMREIVLEHGNREMLDPLSLGDIGVFDPEDGLDVYVLMDGDNWSRESKGK